MKIKHIKKIVIIGLALYNFLCFPEYTGAQPVFKTEVDTKVHKVIEESIEDCFQTLITKVDTIVIPEIQSIDSKLDQWIKPLDEATLSIIETIDNNTIEFENSCCQSLHSVIDSVVIPQVNSIATKVQNLKRSRLAKGDVIVEGENLITEDGLYILGCNMNACVIIDADKVTIDLKGFRLYCDQPNAVIEVLSGHSNIEIKNGKIKGASGLTNDGILIGASCESIKLKDLKIFSCVNGLHLNGAAGDANSVQMCKVIKCQMDECNKGALLTYANNCVFENCGAYNCIEAGFDQSYSDFNVYDTCQALETANDAINERAIGFSSSGGTGNLYTECVAEGTKKTVDSQFGYDAIGFLLTGTEGAMEAETKIINCVANSTSVLSTGSADAYGIFLEPHLKSGSDMTDFIVSTTEYEGTTVRVVDWSKDSRYFAVGGDTGDTKVYRVNYDVTISFITSYPFVTGGSNRNKPIDWSPNGKFLAAGLTTGDVDVLLFDGSTLLSVATQAYGGVVNAVCWSSDGNYLAIGGATSNSLDIYTFISDGITASLTFVNSISVGNAINMIDWSASGDYLAVAVVGGVLNVYNFDGKNLTFVDNITGLGQAIKTNWSSDGRYLSVAQFNTPELLVYEFNGVSLTLVDGIRIGGNNPNIFSADWSPDGKYIVATATTVTDDYEIVIFNFDGTVLTRETGYEWGNSVVARWSPNGKYIIAGGAAPTSGAKIKLFEVMDCPTGCLIDSNRICNASGGDGLHGVGFLGSGENMYLKNTLYANDIHFNDTVIPRYGNLFGPQLNSAGSILDNVFVNS